MKIKYWILCIIIILFAAYMGVEHYISLDSYQKVDMVDVNDRYRQIKEEMDKLFLDSTAKAMEEDLQALEEIQKTFDCYIYIHEDEEYESQVHTAIRNQQILMDYERGGTIFGKVAFDGQRQQINDLFRLLKQRLLLLFLFLFLLIVAAFFVVYIQYIKPFQTLEKFATHIAKGDLDFPLAMTKRNYFGAFTESFDIMREELKRAKQGEYEANISKKELVASLSHDIKTPVSTIRAICEILLLKVKQEDTLERIGVINQKAGMIDTLISDMFHTTLEDLTALKIVPVEELSTKILTMFQEANHYNNIHIVNEILPCLIFMDQLRLNQVVDNVINNSCKYANTDIAVAFADRGDYVAIEITDEGAGVNPEELPLLMGKFYRGANAKGQNGSGLGLYLSKVFMEGMKGTFACENVIKDGEIKGFRVVLELLKV